MNDNRNKLLILGILAPGGHNFDLCPVAPKVNRRPRFFFVVLKTVGGIEKLTWKNIADRKMTAVGDLFLVKLASERKFD